MRQVAIADRKPSGDLRLRGAFELGQSSQPSKSSWSRRACVRSWLPWRGFPFERALAHGFGEVDFPLGGIREEDGPAAFFHQESDTTTGAKLRSAMYAACSPLPLRDLVCHCWPSKGAGFPEHQGLWGNVEALNRTQSAHDTI